MTKFLLPLLMLPGLAVAHINPNDGLASIQDAHVVKTAISTPIQLPKEAGICYPGVTVEAGVVVMACATQ